MRGTAQRGHDRNQRGRHPCSFETSCDQTHGLMADRSGGDEQNGIHRFAGVPYAAPPVGELRWRPPAPAVFHSRCCSVDWRAARYAELFRFGVVLLAFAAAFGFAFAFEAFFFGSSSASIF